MSRGRWERWLVALIAIAAAVVATTSVTVAVVRGTGGDSAERLLTRTDPTSTTVAQLATTLPDQSAPASTTAPPQPTTTTRAPTTTSPPLLDRIVFLGDSLAVNLGEAAQVRAATVTPGIEAVSDGISGCGVARSGDYVLGGVHSPLHPVCGNWNVEWAEALRRDRPKVVVIQVGRHEVVDRQLHGEWTNILDPEYADYVRSELETAVSLAGEDGREVVLLTAPYFRGSSSFNRPEDDPARVDRFNQLLAQVAAGRDRVQIIDLGGRASPYGEYTADVDGVRVRDDGVHYSPDGAVWAVDWLLPQIAGLVAVVPG